MSGPVSGRLLPDGTSSPAVVHAIRAGRAMADVLRTIFCLLWRVGCPPPPPKGRIGSIKVLLRNVLKCRVADQFRSNIERG